MNHKTVTSGIVALAMVAMMASSALAGPWGQGQGQGRGMNAPQLTQEQIAQVQKDHAAYLDATVDLRKQLAVKQVEMRTLASQTNVDKAKVTTLANEIIDLRAQLAKERVKYMGNDVGMVRGLCGGPGAGYGPGDCPAGGPGNGPGRGMGGGRCFQ